MTTIATAKAGSFTDFQAASRFAASLGAAIAGIVLNNNDPRFGFTMCFLFAVGAFIVSYVALFLPEKRKPSRSLV